MNPISFTFHLMFTNQVIRLKATRIDYQPAFEIWQVDAKNKMLVFECDRPAMVAEGAGHLMWNWKLKQGETSEYWQREITQALGIVVRRMMHQGKI